QRPAFLRAGPARRETTRRLSRKKKNSRPPSGAVAPVERRRAEQETLSTDRATPARLTWTTRALTKAVAAYAPQKVVARAFFGCFWGWDWWSACADEVDAPRSVTTKKSLNKVDRTHHRSSSCHR